MSAGRTALSVRTDSYAGPPREESVHALVGRLIGDVLRLLEQQVALATLEMKQHIEMLAHTAILFLVGGFLAMIGLLLLATAAALGIGHAVGSLIAGYAIVGGVIVIAGAIAAGVARSRLARHSLAPAQTIDEIRRDATWMRHEVERRSGSGRT
jgi:uncharacterized membrane protein YqjE